MVTLDVQKYGKPVSVSAVMSYHGGKVGKGARTELHIAIVNDLS